MRGVVVDLEVEGLVTGLPDRRFCLLGHRVRVVVADLDPQPGAALGVAAALLVVVGPAQACRDGAVDVLPVAVELTGRVVGRIGDPLVPPGRNDRLRGGIDAAVVVHELAEMHGPVASPLKPDRQVLEHDRIAPPGLPPATRPADPDYLVVLGVTPAEQGCP